MRTSRIIACTLAAACCSFTAFAKPPAAPAPGAAPAATPPAPARGGDAPARQPLSAEKAKAAWELQAGAVCKHLGANDEQTKAVVKVYSEARASQAAGSEKIRQEFLEKAKSTGGGEAEPRGRGGRGEGGGGSGGGGGGLGAEGQKALEDLANSEREKLRKGIAAVLTPDQTTKAMASLGTFNRQWDNMTDAIASFKLDAAKQQPALVAVEEFVVAQAKARSSAADGGDRDAMRTAMQESRQKLNDSLKKILSDDQFKAFEDATRGGMGRGGRN